MTLSIGCGNYCWNLEWCREDKRFRFLPNYRLPRMEWLDIVDGKWNLWDRARVWPHLDLLESSTAPIQTYTSVISSLFSRGITPNLTSICTSLGHLYSHAAELCEVIPGQLYKRTVPEYGIPYREDRRIFQDKASRPF